MREHEFAELFDKRPTTIKLDLDRVRAVYQHLGSPALATPTILIAGTNGKGTTAGFLWQMLQEIGLNVGLYTSPHLIDVCERVQVSAKRIDDAAIMAVWQWLRQRLAPDVYAELTFFEVMTLIALQIFADTGTDCNVVEVGMGGRLDATNILAPAISVITSLGLDHQDYLGDTLAAIAAEKVAIARSGRPLIFGQAERPNYPDMRLAIDTAADYVTGIGASFFAVGRDFVIDEAQRQLVLSLASSPMMRLQLPAALYDRASYLRDNFATAVAAMAHLLTQPFMQPRIPTGDLQQVLADLLAKFPYSTTWPAAASGRNQELHVRLVGAAAPAKLLLDVGHNQAGMVALRAALEQRRAASGVTKFPGIISILADKDFDAMLDVLQGILAPIVLFKCDHARSWQKSSVAARHQQLPFFGDFASAWHYARQHFGNPSAPTVVCGSVVAVGQVLDFFQADLRGSRFDQPLAGVEPARI